MSPDPSRNLFDCGVGAPRKQPAAIGDIENELEEFVIGR